MELARFLLSPKVALKQLISNENNSLYFHHFDRFIGIPLDQ